MRIFFSKYKIYLILSIVCILILIYFQFFTNNAPKVGQVASPSPFSLPTPLEFTTLSYSQPPLNSEGQVDTNSEKVITAVVNKDKLEKALPIYIKNFHTSNGMLTTLNVYTIPEDPNYLVHIEIYGIDFQSRNTSEADNPNVTAFIDSFNEIKKQLAGKDVNIHNIYFIFGQRSYIQSTADLWIKTFGLL